jgi:ACT domain-containing protein
MIKRAKMWAKGENLDTINSINLSHCVDLMIMIESSSQTGIGIAKMDTEDLQACLILMQLEMDSNDRNFS